MDVNESQVASLLRSFISSKEVYTSLVQEVLKREELERDKIPESDTFRHACINWASTDGYRRGSVPPFPLLVNTGVRIVMRHSGAFLHLLNSFCVLEAETVGQIREIIGRKLQQDEPIGESPEFTGLVKEVAQELKEQVGCSWGDERLSVVVGAALILPSLAEPEEQREEEENPVTNELIDIIEAISPDDPFWGHLDQFFTKVEAIKTAKTQASLTEAELRELLESLDNEHGAMLNEYFNLQINPWQVETVQLSSVGRVLELLPEFMAMLDKYNGLTLTKPRTLDERRALREDQQHLEAKIATAWSKINDLFVEVDTPPLETDDEPEPGQGLGSQPEPGPQSEPEPETEQEQEPEPLDQEAEETKAGDNIDDPPTQPPSGRDGKARDPKESRGKSVVEKVQEPEVILEDWTENPILLMLHKNDLAGAYWLARSREHLQEQNPLPAWLIAAMEGSRYLLMPGFRLAKDFTYPIDHYLYNGDSFQELCALGVGLVSALVEPASNSALWLEPQTNLPNLQRIIDVIRGFTKQGIALNKRDLLVISNLEQRNQMIIDAARRCQDLVQTHTRRRLGLPRANRIWQGLCDDEQYLAYALHQIVGNRRDSVGNVKETLTAFSTVEKIFGVVQDLDLRLMRKKDKPLPAHLKERITRMVAEIVEAAQEWVDLVEHSDKESNDWKQAQISRLVHDLQIYSKPCLDELEAAGQTAGKESVAYGFIFQNIKLLLQYIRGARRDSGVETHWIFQDSETIEQVLAKRLLIHPELELGDNGLPTDNDLAKMNNLLGPQPQWQRLSKEIYRAWLDKQDYRFLDLVLRGIDAETKVEEELRERAARLRQGSRDNLEEYIRRTSINIEATLVNVGLSEEQRNELVSLTESLDSTSILNFAPALTLLQQINRELEAETERRVQHQTEIWQEFSSRLGEIATAKEADLLRDLIKQAIDKGDTRVVDEYLTRVRDHLERRERLSLTTEQASVRNYLSDFSKFRHVLPKGKGGSFGVAEQAVRQEKNWASLQYAGISPKQLQLTKRAMTAWRNLSRRYRGSLARSVTDLFTFLGFTITDPIADVSFPGPAGHLHLAIKMTASDQARPFPQFGSRAEPTFDVLMVWERPRADNLGTAISEAKLGVESTIVLYFGRIGDSVRQDMARMTRRRNLAIAILDETLFLFLTGERDAHLRAFLRCSVPYGTVIPYTPRIMGDVPPEIFYGRQKAADLLQRRDGSCLVYGGRQMGKSALLRYVMRKAHNPERGQYAWVEDVKPLGDSYSGEEPGKIWPRLWHLLCSEGLFSGRAPEQEEIINALGGLLRKERDLQILLMLDEADNFLNRDSARGFKTVSQLRNLMTDSERRFKVIFAGLQHVQRFQSMPNQPLAHFGDPILVGPLEEQAAADLVREPLEALGFSLDDACVYRILSFTNYHPGLIQYFCYHLLERLYKKAQVFPTPFRPLEITREDVETIYLQDDIRERIRERFEWTLALDPRYQVIVWAMIVAQTKIRDSFSQKFSVSDLFSLAKDYWPTEFNGMDSDVFRGILRELAGLGVLATPDGQYRLKSPNLVRIMGDEADVENRLFGFVDAPAMQEMEADSYHEQIDDKNQIYSAFTFEQARSIDRKLDFRIFATSQALGLEHMEESIKHLYATAENTVLRRIPVSVDSEEELQRLIRKEENRAKKNGKDFLVLYQVVDKAQTTPLETIRAAYAHYQEELKRRKPKGTSIFFVINPVTFWELLKLDEKLIRLLSEEGLIASTKLWNDRGIGQRLDNYNKLSNDETRNAIVQAGGRWPYLLAEIMARCGKEKDAKSAAEAVNKSLANDEGFRQLFLAKLDLPEESSFHAVLEFIAKNTSVPLEIIAPEYGGLLSETNEKQCRDAVEVLLQYGLIELDGDVATIDPTVRMALTP